MLMPVAMLSGSWDLEEIVLSQRGMWHCVPRLPRFGGFRIGMLAETNRHPFDLPEAEAELVSGYNVEYSGGGFALFFLGEYANMLRMSTLGARLFLGGWLPRGGSRRLGALALCGKTLRLVMVFVWARAAYPRYRFDQLMQIGWKSLLPRCLGYWVFVNGFVW